MMSVDTLYDLETTLRREAFMINFPRLCQYLQNDKIAQMRVLLTTYRQAHHVAYNALIFKSATEEFILEKTMTFLSQHIPYKHHYIKDHPSITLEGKAALQDCCYNATLLFETDRYIWPSAAGGIGIVKWDVDQQKIHVTLKPNGQIPLDRHTGFLSL